MRVVRVLAYVLPFAFAALLASQEPEQGSREARHRERMERELDTISAVVKGRCVDGETGRPLAGCKIELDAWGGSRDDQLSKELLRPSPFTTREDGLFSVRVLACEDYQVGFDASHAGCWPRTGRWRSLLAGVVEDVGDVRLYPGVVAVGKVVDDHGQPVPGIQVGITGMPLPLDSESRAQVAVGPRMAQASPQRAIHRAANSVRYAVSGADGLFTGEGPLPPGSFHVDIANREWNLVEPVKITIPDNGPMQPVTIIVHQEPYIAGVVVDDTGAPTAGVTLEAELSGSGRIASGRSRQDGTFRIYRVERAPAKVRLFVREPGPCERAVLPDEHAWGDHDVRVQLRRALTVDLRVVVASTGEPVEDYAVCYHALDRPLGFSSRDHELRFPGKHEDGRLRIDCVPRGAERLGVMAKDPTLRFAWIDFVAADGMEALRVEMERMVPMMVQVLDASGLPVAHATVMVIDPGNQRNLGDTFSDPRNGRVISANDPTARFDELLHHGTTDAGGQCIVYGLDHREDLKLVVRVGDVVRARVDKVSFGKKHGSRQIQIDPK